MSERQTPDGEELFSPNISLVINLSVKNGWVCCCMQISRPGRQAGTEALLLLCFPSPPSSPLLQREQTARWYMGHQVSTEWCMESGYEESTFTAWRTCTHDRWRILPNVVQLLMLVVTGDDIISICASKCYRCLVVQFTSRPSLFSFQTIAPTILLRLVTEAIGLAWFRKGISVFFKFILFLLLAISRKMLYQKI